MLARIIDFHLKHRVLVLAGLIFVIAFGVMVMMRIPIEAFPDLTNNQVSVITECPAMPPSEVEQLVTYPIEVSLMGMPRTEQIRSISKLGVSIVTVIFEDSVNTYFARQLINERLQEVRERLPQGIQPNLGPVATAFGEVYQYTINGQGYSAMEMKTIHEWTVKNQLRTVPGVNEVNTWGGETKQYQVEVDPDSLARYGLNLREVFDQIRDNNANFGGGYIEHASEQFTVLGLGRAQVIPDLERIVVLARAGTPVLLRDVATVAEKPMQRQGAVLRDGKGETVSGMTIMLKGENGRTVIDRVKQKLASIRLPEGLSILPFYDQSTVIDSTIATVKKNLAEAALLVTAVLLVFLGNFKAAVIVASVIPLSMLVGFLGMKWMGISANLMSLGAIDFGMIVDGAVVMMENSIGRLQAPLDGEVYDPLERIREAAHEVARPILFAVMIITAVYMPIMFFEGLEGRMFRPMAITVVAALIGSLVFAMTVVPTATSVFLRHGLKEHKDPRWFAALKSSYLWSLDWVLRNRTLTMGVSLVVLAVAMGSLAFIGTEFMPRLDEGSLLITTRKLPGISLSDSIEASNRIEKAVLEFPEVTGVVTKLGRPDLATEAMGIYEADVYVAVQPYKEWKAGKTKEDLISEMSAKLEKIPGVNYNFTQPMAMRLDEVVSGIKADVAVKIFGEDPKILEQLAEKTLKLLSNIPGSADAQMEIISGVGELHVSVDRQRAARYGLNVEDIRELVEAAVSGKTVSEMVQGQRRFAIVVRLPERYRMNEEALKEITFSAPGGERVRLGQVADVEVTRGPEVVSREGGQRRIVVQSNVRGRDLGSFVADAQERLDSQLQLPAGYSIDWGGQFENQARAMRRLMIVLPASILIIFGLLFVTFDSVPQALLLLLNVPFAMVGGIASLWLRNMNLNLSAAVGFIALFGVAVLNGIIVVSHMNRLRAQGMPCRDAVRHGSVDKFRSVLMTALVPSLGFVPMAFSTSPGSEVQRPLATVVIGGLVTATGLTLYLLPLLYPWFSPKDKRIEEITGL